MLFGGANAVWEAVDESNNNTFIIPHIHTRVGMYYSHLLFPPCLVSFPILWADQPSHQQTGSEWSPSDDYADTCKIIHAHHSSE